MAMVLQDAMADVYATAISTMAGGTGCLAKRLLAVDEEPRHPLDHRIGGLDNRPHARSPLRSRRGHRPPARHLPWHMEPRRLGALLRALMPAVAGGWPSVGAQGAVGPEQEGEKGGGRADTTRRRRIGAGGTAAVRLAPGCGGARPQGRAAAHRQAPAEPRAGGSRARRRRRLAQMAAALGRRGGDSWVEAC
ncbi:hypothetical protein C2845_PM09G10760 [Panicum miliaceum]|uniref:Uncharacterized protein n=1 Tax=Panicum miliaceum TaxID=4540 RepID=A0A3L6S0D9_PANMI|nr:hypothetical protein C2845_PM09G10760 [Panicum miliaceum]